MTRCFTGILTFEALDRRLGAGTDMTLPGGAGAPVGFLSCCKIIPALGGEAAAG